MFRKANTTNIITKCSLISFYAFLNQTGQGNESTERICLMFYRVFSKKKSSRRKRDIFKRVRDFSM